jgi:adenylylsulfate kinase-like enzyme
MHASAVPTLVTITGPIAAGKNAAADDLANRFTASGQTAVIADVDDVAAMVVGSGAAAAGLWFAAHKAHGALVAQWMRSKADVIIAVGPVYTEAEQDALFGGLPTSAHVWRVLLDAPLSVTWKRVRDDPHRGLSRQREFHQQAHERFLSLRPGIPADVVFDSHKLGAAAISSALFDMIKVC